MAVKKIALLDLWTDSNRGDNALQAGLITMVRHKWPDAEVNGVFRFGLNEFESAKKEIEYTSDMLDGVYGGLRKTYYSADNFNKYSGVTHKLVSMYSFIELVVLMFLYKLGLKFIIPRKHLEVMELLSESDMIIWKGKNFRDYGGLAGLNRQATLLVAGKIGAFFNSNLFCVNASVWNMTNKFERALTKNVLSKCKVITVRERESYDNLCAIMGSKQNIHFSQDLSFYDLKHNYDANGQEKGEERIYDLALTITDWGTSEEKENYISMVSGIVRRLSKNGVKKVAIVPQVTRAAEENSEIVDRIISSGLQDIEVEILPGEPSIKRLLDYYSKSKMVVGTRMHSCVFSRSVNTPFIAIAYDQGPKWSILSEFWPKEYIHTYTSNPEIVIDAAEKLHKNIDSALKSSLNKFQKLSNESFSNVGHIDIK